MPPEITGSVSEQLPIYRTWSSYKAGFSDAAGDNWIGECTLYSITDRGAPTRLDLVMPPEITGSVRVHLTI